MNGGMDGAGAGCPSLRCWINCSSGIVSEGDFTGMGPVLSITGVRMGTSEFGFKNGWGKVGDGSGSPAGIGRTTSGVTMISSSELLRDMDLLWKSLPISGMLESPGILFRVSVIRL